MTEDRPDPLTGPNTPAGKRVKQVTWLKDAAVQFIADLETGEGTAEEPVLYDQILHCFVTYDDGTTAEFGTEDSDVTDPEALDAIDIAWRSCFEGGPA